MQEDIRGRYRYLGTRSSMLRSKRTKRKNPGERLSAFRPRDAKTLLNRGVVLEDLGFFDLP
jgi:hypothetical protein